MEPDQVRATLARRLRTQSRECAKLGSALYAELMERGAADVEAGGPFLDVLTGHEHDPGPFALALRLFGGAHRIALEGRAPELAAHYPSTGGDGDVEGAWEALRALVAAERDELEAGLAHGPQTNEVGRSAALAPGFWKVATDTGLPLCLLEIGSSAGLNLRWDHFRHEVTEPAAGDPMSRVVFPASWYADPLPPTITPVAEVLERRGCDIAPIDGTVPAERIRLLSYVWPDQPERFHRISAAIDVAGAVPAVVERAEAVEWLQQQLAEPRPGQATVVFHSIFIQYLTDQGRVGLAAALDAAGARATTAAPLAYLRLEPVAGRPEVRLQTWPGGDDHLVAVAGFHGPIVKFGA